MDEDAASKVDAILTPTTKRLPKPRPGKSGKRSSDQPQSRTTKETYRNEARHGIRTQDLRIKSPLLYRLSLTPSSTILDPRKRTESFPKPQRGGGPSAPPPGSQPTSRAALRRHAQLAGVRPVLLGMSGADDVDSRGPSFRKGSAGRFLSCSPRDVSPFLVKLAVSSFTRLPVRPQDAPASDTFPHHAHGRNMRRLTTLGLMMILGAILMGVFEILPLRSPWLLLLRSLAPSRFDVPLPPYWQPRPKSSALLVSHQQGVLAGRAGPLVRGPRDRLRRPRLRLDADGPGQRRRFRHAPHATDRRRHPRGSGRLSQAAAHDRFRS